MLILSSMLSWNIPFLHILYDKKKILHTESPNLSTGDFLHIGPHAKGRANTEPS